MTETLIKVEKVSKKFCRSLKRSLWYGMKDMGSEFLGCSSSPNVLREGEFWANKDISFELERGECLGLIGRNGAGKTTLLRILNGLIKPDTGRVEIRGRVGALIALGTGFNPLLTGRENIYIYGSVLGLSMREIEAKIEEIIDFSEVRDAIDMPLQNYSSGMQVRLGFAIASAVKPDVLLLDEVLAVGDVRFQAKCYSRIGELKNDCAVIFVSHSMNSIARMADQLLFLEGGMAQRFDLVQDGIVKYYEMNRQQNQMKIKREGTGKVEIVDARVNVVNEEVVGIGNFTSKIVAEIDMRSFVDLELCIDFVFRNMAGQAVAECPSSRSYSPISIGADEQKTVKFTIDPVPLASGLYLCSVYLFDLNCAEHYHTWLEFDEINVLGDNRYTSPIQLHAKWEITGSSKG